MTSRELADLALTVGAIHLVLAAAILLSDGTLDLVRSLIGFAGVFAGGYWRLTTRHHSQA